MNDTQSSSTRRRLIDVSGRLFAEHGYDGVSVRRICREAKANLGAVTYHFRGKEGLFAAVMAEKTEGLRALGKVILSSRKAPDAKLREMLEVYAMRVMHEDPGLKILFAETVAAGTRLPQAAVDGVAWRNRMFADVVREGIQQGVFRSCDVEFLSWNFFEMLSSYILCQPLMRRLGHGGRSGKYPRAFVKRAVDAALDVFMNGLRKPGGGGRRSRSGRREKSRA